MEGIFFTGRRKGVGGGDKGAFDGLGRFWEIRGNGSLLARSARMGTSPNFSNVMDYIKTILGKASDEISYKDIVNYFKVLRTESDIVEFKSFSTPKREGKPDLGIDYTPILNTICAFLNSEGGLLIWGAPKEKEIRNEQNRKEKVFDGELSPVNQKIEKDTITNKINDSIIPLPSGIRIKILEHNELYLYLFVVDKSDYSPHRTKDGLYYMRLDGQSRIAPHHYVEALFRKVSYPNLAGRVKFLSISSWENDLIKLLIEVYIFNKSQLQNEEQLSFTLAPTTGYFPIQQFPLSSNRRIQRIGSKIRDPEATKILHYGVPFYQLLELVMDPLKLEEDQNRFGLGLIFGGKHSPMKISQYYLRIEPGHYSNLEKAVYSRIEDKFLYELEDEGSNIDENIEIILGRN